MTLQLEINGSSDASARYVSFAPSPCRIRQTDGGSDLRVKLQSQQTIPGIGGEIVFYTPLGSAPQPDIILTLPGDGSWVDFSIAGRWGRASVDDGDCLLVVSGEAQAEVPLMVRVRKNANTLQPEERDRFLDAWKVLNNAGQGKFQAFRDMHVRASSAEEHRGPQFLPWHRTYLLDLERELQAIDPSVALHYWRFDQPAPKVFRGNFMGATTQVAEGDPTRPVVFDPGHPLSSWVTDDTPGINRAAFFNTQTSAAPGFANFRLLDQTQTLALGDTYSDFADMERTPHGAAHVSFAGYIDDIPTAAKDPLFFMLHCNVDRLWALWQWVNRRTDPDDTRVYLGQNRDGRRVDDTTWPWNNVTSPPPPPAPPGQRPTFAPRGQDGLASSPATPNPGARPMIRSVIDYQGHTSPTGQIGYGYDTVPFEFA